MIWRSVKRDSNQSNILWAICASLLCAPALSEETHCNRDLGAWLQCNNPLVIGYLRNLETADIGTVVNGIELTDGHRELENHAYQGQVNETPTGVHIYVFRHRGTRVAFLWVDEDAEPFPLPPCPMGAVPGAESAHVLSGDVYTWRSAQPGDGVIQVNCVAPSWDIEKE